MHKTLLLLALIVLLSKASEPIGLDGNNLSAPYPLEIYSQEFGFDLQLRSYTYLYFFEPYAGVNYRIQWQGIRSKKLFLIGLGVRRLPFEVLIPYAEVGFGKIRGKREVRCVGNFGLALDINDDSPRHGWVSIEGMDLGIKGEFLSFRTRRRNCLSFMSPSATLTFDPFNSDFAIWPNLGVEFFRMSFNMVE